MKRAVEWGVNSVEHQVERLFSLHHETNVTALKVSSGVNLYHWQVLLVARRKFEKVLRK